MNAVPFDTLKMARKVEAAGFTAAQSAGAAEAMAEAMSGAELATKGDVERGIGQVRTDLENRLELLQRDITIRLGAMMIASTGILLAAMRFMTMHS
jgi:hypothetical protein